MIAALRFMGKLTVATSAVFLFLILAFLFSYPGRLMICEVTLAAYQVGEFEARNYCLEKTSP